MLVYPSGVDVSSSAPRFLAARLREHRRARGTRWRRLNAGRWDSLSTGQQAVNRSHAKSVHDNGPSAAATAMEPIGCVWITRTTAAKTAALQATALR